MSYIGNEPVISATRTVTEITATAGQTVFTANGGYTVGFIDVFVNGSQLTASDFTATNGSTITLNEAATVNDIVRLVAWGTFQSANAVLLTGNSNLTGNLNVSGNLGVGTTSPQGKLDVVGMNRISSAAPSFPTTGTGLEIYYDGTNDNGRLQSYSRSSSAWKDFVLAGNNLLFQTNASERMRIDSSGRVTMPFQPAFQAVLNGNVNNPGGSATRLTSWNKVSNPIINARDAAFSTATGRFTAPVAGLYLMGIHVDLSGGLSSGYYLAIGINGGNRQYDLIEDTTIATNGGFFVCRIVPMAVNDYAEIYMLGGNWTLNGGGNQWNTRWEGFLIS